MPSRGQPHEEEVHPRTRDDAKAARLRVGAVVLAAGRSTRMGRPKTMLMLDDRTLLEHAVDRALASRADEVVVVVRGAELDAHRSSASAGVRYAAGADSDSGLSGSLRLGLAALSPEVDAAAILLGDQPVLDAGLIDEVVAEAERTGGPATRPVYVHAGTRTPGHPFVLARRAFAGAARLTGDEGARALFRDAPSAIHEIEIDSPPPPDVDTPEDYEQLVTDHAADRRC